MPPTSALPLRDGVDRRPARRRHVRVRQATVMALALTLMTTSCGLFDKGDGETSLSSTAGALEPIESGLGDAGTPKRGGQLVYGLEAEAAKGYCLPQSELAISGMQVARAIYDTLTVPNAKGGYAPYLAKAVTPSNDYRTWTIVLRSGITFHDGTKLDANVVKNNLDAFRGKYPGRSPLLFSFVFQDVDTVSVVNELTVEVTTKVPWVAFPAALYGSGRIGMMAQAQLDADDKGCANQPIGTGPFSFVSWSPNVALRVKRNPGYWQEAPDGKPYPYLNAIEFRPMANSDARVAALQQGELNMLHTSTASDVADNLSRLQTDGAINLLVSSDHTETAYLMMNTASDVFASLEPRLAVAHAIDRKKLNELSNKGLPILANGPFAPGVMGHLDNTGNATFDLAAAKKAVAKLKADGKPTKFRFVTSNGPAAIRQAEIQRAMLETAGFEVTLEVANESDLISKVIAGEYDLAAFRNQPGEDPDMNRVWWYGPPNPVNFGRFEDPVINKALDTGRQSADRDKRQAAYETVNRQFAKQVWNVYLWFSPWAVAEAANVHGILGPNLPGDGGPPAARLVTGHSLLGVWIDRSE